MDQIDGQVQELWCSVVRSCNMVLHHAKVYGIQLMDIPDPDIHKIAKVFDTVVIPLLDELARDYEFSPESGMKMANIKQFAMHLRAITIAVDEDDAEELNRDVDLLTNEAMLTS